jgi:hypothetical protein
MKFLLTFLSLLSAANAFSAEKVTGYGISSWAGWKPGQVSRATCPELRNVPLIIKWDSLETAPGNYLFEERIGKAIQAAVADDLYVWIKIYVGPACPAWIYEQGVPVVTTDRTENALGEKIGTQTKYPYYLHPEYRKRFAGMIREFGRWMQTLPPELRQRILFVQSAEGSTGDGSPYKGKPLDKQYVISEEQWNDLRRETWQQYREAISGMPIVVNSDSNTPKETEWLLANMDTFGLKVGMFTHGYQVSDNDKRLAAFESLESRAKQLGKKVITRGEMDGELYVYGWAKNNIPQTLYWSGLFASHCRVDVWNIPSKALTDPANRPAFSLFNKYAGHKEPSASPIAFCALRDGLDAADFKRFPAETYGGKPGAKSALDRYERISKTFASYGAQMVDPKKATGGGMLNRKASGPNDVGWGTISENYSRFLTQIDPGSGDVGRWNIDQTIYGRYGRAFEQKTGKTQMRFQLDPHFGASEVKINITYLDQGTGTWSVGTPEKKDLLTVQNTNSGQWKVKSVNSGNMSQLALNYLSGDDTIFHLIEIERVEVRP